MDKKYVRFSLGAVDLLAPLFVFCVLIAASGTALGMASANKETTVVLTEPSAEIANGWWQEDRNVWTPIGWKNHIFQFNVLYNGTIVAEPKRYVEKYGGPAIQLTVTASADGKIPSPLSQEPYLLSNMPDRGIGNQGWTENSTPVLWTDWPFGMQGYGIVVREEIFAHIPGAGDVKSGAEPLYAWTRLSVKHSDQWHNGQYFFFTIGLHSPHIERSMEQDSNLRVTPKYTCYSGQLTAEQSVEGSRVNLTVFEADKKIRLAVIGPEGGRVDLVEGKPGANDYYLRVMLPIKKGAHADILLPMVPAESKEFEKEFVLGYDNALKQSDTYWSIVPENIARIDTPEKQVNEAIERSVKFAEVIAEKNPDTGEYSFLSGTWHYTMLWSTPTSWVSHMLLDIMGYPSIVEKHIELFRGNQGTVKPPGPAYKLHPGYFSSPKVLTSIDWMSDHGAILYTVCKHALLTGDRQFIEKWHDSIIKGCEFIKDSRTIQDVNSVAGLLPGAVTDDRMVPTQSGWNMGWNYKGLVTAVRLLREISDPRAEEFAREAESFREVFVKALQKRAAEMPRWTDDKGNSHVIVPDSLSAGGNIVHSFYLDTGPMFLVWSGLADADDELMREAVLFFREGPNTKVYDPRGYVWQRPVLVHEISSCEPCYSWNIFHSWQLGDRYKFLEAMYSLLSGAISRQTYISCETRHGIHGNIFANPIFVYLVRLSVIDDEIEQGQLHLLRLVPKAWLKTDYQTRFENMPTEFGPVTIKFKLAEQGKVLDVSYQAKFRHQPKKTVLHVPPVAGLVKVIVNGKATKARPGDVLLLD